MDHKEREQTLLDQELFAAIEESDITEVVRLVQKGANVRAKNSFGNTPLHYAVEEGDIKIVEYLIDQGAEINVKSQGDVMPLHSAIFAGNIGIIKILIENRAEINAQDKDGLTPLHYAIDERDISIIEYLIIGGADINARTICYETPLMFAVENDDEKTAEYLIDQGANIDALFEDDGTSILTHVVLKNHPTIFKLFVSKGAALNFGAHKLTPEMQNYADTAKVVDSLFIEGVVINQEENRNIEEDIFISRYKKLFINKGYIGSCQQNINNLNLYCPTSSEEKNELIALIKENQENIEIFQNNCAEISNNLRSEHIIQDLHDLFLPRKVQELINSSFQSIEPEDTDDIEVVGDNQE